MTFLFSESFFDEFREVCQGEMDSQNLQTLILMREPLTQTDSL